jgi:uncharacterized ion transporter superfamily protein YfcC
VARGVTTIMNNSGITDTVLHALEGAVSGLSSGAFAVVMYKVRYDRYLRFVAPLLGILLILTCLFMLLGVAVPASEAR